MKLDFDFSSILGSNDILGIDIGSFSIKIIQLKNSGTKWSLVRRKTIIIPEEIANADSNPLEKKTLIASLIKDFIKQDKVSVKNAAISVSGSSVVVRYVKFPKISKEDLAKSIQFEAEPYIPFDIKEVNLGFYIIGEITEDGQKKTETVLVAAKKDIIQSKIEILQEAGINPMVIDVDAFALESCYDINKDPQAQEMAIIVNIGANVTNVTIIENGISRVVRDIFVGGNAFTKALQKSFQSDFKKAEELKKKFGLLVTVEDKEAALKEDNKDALQISNVLSPVAHDLLSEIHRSIDFFYSQRGEQQVLNRVLLSGGTSALKNIDKYFAQELKIQTEIFNPFKNVDKSSNIQTENIGEYGISVGLATRQAKEK